MRNILIIYPHWPPSNLAGVHRPRLIANFLPAFGWHPIVITVHPDFYEERLDWDLCKAVSPDVEVIHVPAWKLRKLRLIGDIGLRSFVFLYRKALAVIREREIDFIWIPIPSFYVAVLGRILNIRTNVPYGIDYIDPWVRNIEGRKNFRHVLSNMLARILEPVALKRASLISGVAEDYYWSALKRNFKNPDDQAKDHLNATSANGSVHHLAFPYGFDPHDSEFQFENIRFPWNSVPQCKPIVYAGAFLPHAHLFVKVLFDSVKKLIRENKWDEHIHFYFLGTGLYPGKTILSYARDFGIEHIVHEVRERFSFFEVLHFLKHSFAVMIIGSTERHYSASKIFQGVASTRPIFAVLHEGSSAASVLKEVNADLYLVLWDKVLSEGKFQERLSGSLNDLLFGYRAWSPDYDTLVDKYSSKESARKLAGGIDNVLRIASR